MRKFSVVLFVAFACVGAQAGSTTPLRGSREWVRFPANPVLRVPDDKAIVTSYVMTPSRTRRSGSRCGTAA